MLIDHWPLLGLRVRTARLELRLPTEEELADLADLAVRGVHERARDRFSDLGQTCLPPNGRAK
jgi:hypothetical protein